MPDTLQCVISVNSHTTLWGRFLLSPFTGEETEDQRDNLWWNQTFESGLSEHSDNDFLCVIHAGTAARTKAGR